MSIYYGYVCRSHEPHISSERWYNHGDELLELLYVLERGGHWPKIPDPLYKPEEWDMVNVSFRGHDNNTHALQWLGAHPHCDIALQDENNNVKELQHKTWNPERLLQHYRARKADNDELIMIIQMALSS